MAGLLLLPLTLTVWFEVCSFSVQQYTDAIEWILRNNYGIPQLIHYLDDFFIVSATHEEAMLACSTILLLDKLGIQWSPEKAVGPAQNLTFLGIELDSQTRQLRLPAKKYEALLTTVVALLSRRRCTKRELLSLIGSLSFACKVVPAGRIFLRRLIDLSKTVVKLHHHIRLSAEAKADLQRWHECLPHWDGVSFMLDPHWSTATALQLFTDASGSYGCGGFFLRENGLCMLGLRHSN